MYLSLGGFKPQRFATNNFDISHLRWPWSTKTYGRSSTSTGRRWWSPSLAGESFLSLFVSPEFTSSQSFHFLFLQFISLYILKATLFFVNKYLRENLYHGGANKTYISYHFPHLFIGVFSFNLTWFTNIQLIQSTLVKTCARLPITQCPMPMSFGSSPFSSCNCIIFILVPCSKLLRAIIIIPNGVVSVSERTKPAIKIASFLPGFILMPAKR